jgi:hypothetical protein
VTSPLWTGKPLSFFYSAAQGQSVQKSGDTTFRDVPYNVRIVQGTRRPRDALSKGHIVWGYLVLSPSIVLHTDKKEHQIFLIHNEIQKGSVAKSYMTNDLLNPHIWLNICVFPHILGGPSSYITLQPIPSEFP